MTNRVDFHEQCRAYLGEIWQQVQQVFQTGDDQGIDEPLADRPDLVGSIRASLNSKTQSYRYVLLTQLRAKAVNSELDVHFLQAGINTPGAFDARSLAKSVIVPFDQANQNVLGGSPEPYVNKPLRFPGVFPEHRHAQLRPEDWDHLLRVLDAVQSAHDVQFTRNAFRQVLVEIHRLLEGTTVTYPTPARVSLENTLRVAMSFVRDKSGGDRLEAVVTALLRTVGHRFGLFTRVIRGKVNSADKASGMAADIECYDNGSVLLLVEVKDRSLTLLELNATLGKARSKQVREILFVAQQGIGREEQGLVQSRVQNEFASGQNVYVTDLTSLMNGVLVLLMEQGRVEFLKNVSAELESGNSSIHHRKAWAELLSSI